MESIKQNKIKGGNGISIFWFLKNLHIAFHKGWTNLHSYQQCRRVPLSPHLRQYLLFLIFSMLAILTGMKWYLIVVLIFISLINHDMKHFFICLLAIWISSLDKCLFISSTHFLIGLFAFWVLRHVSSLYILYVNPLSDRSFTNIFSHTVGCIFVSVDGVLCCTETF